VLTHHPQDAAPADRVTFLDRDPAEAGRIGPAAVGGKNPEVFSPTIGRQLLEPGLTGEIDLHIAPVLLGEGIRLYGNPGSKPIRLHRIGEGNPTSASTYGTGPPQQRRSRPKAPGEPSGSGRCRRAGQAHRSSCSARHG
jgi:hypothetical protein